MTEFNLAENNVDAAGYARIIALAAVATIPPSARTQSGLTSFALPNVRLGYKEEKSFMSIRTLASDRLSKEVKPYHLTGFSLRKAGCKLKTDQVLALRPSGRRTIFEGEKARSTSIVGMEVRRVPRSESPQHGDGAEPT
jgi:hypothetical protein